MALSDATGASVLLEFTGSRKVWRWQRERVHDRGIQPELRRD